MNDNFSLAVAGTLVSLALYLWTAASLHAVFRKAGEEGWQAWVPVLNLIVLLRLGGFSGWWALLLLIPGVGALALAVIVWIACHRINLAFGSGVGMTVLAIILFPVWSSILGWGSARWLGREQRSPGPMRSQPAPPYGARYETGPFAGGPLPASASGASVAAPRPAPPLPAPAASWSSSSGPGALPFDNAPPRPPLSSAGWPAAPANPTRVPSAASDVDDDDDAHALGYLPRPAGGLPPTVPAAAPDSPGQHTPVAGDGDRRAAPYTGALPLLIDPEARESPAGPRRAVAPVVDDASDPALYETRDASPISAPARAIRDPWAPPVVEVLPVRTPRYSPMPGDSGFSETSAEVSAVAGAPSLGWPVSARSSVSSLRDEPELPDAESAFDETIIATRRRTPWMLTPPLGAPIAVTSDVLIVGRRPSSDPALGHAQLVPVADETRTMSKTHARLELRGDVWMITDLDSTNGVVLVSPDGSEVEIASGRPEPVTESFLLGDAELRLAREPGVE